MALGRHGGDLKAQDFSMPGLDGQRHAEGLTFGMLARFQIIELKGAERTLREFSEPEGMLVARSQGFETKLPHHGFAVHP